MTELTARELLLMLYDIAQQAAGSHLNPDSNGDESLQAALLAVEGAARFEGLNSFIHASLLGGNSGEAAGNIYQSVKNAEAGIHIWSANMAAKELTPSGVGGGNQMLALLFARYISADPGLHMLAASLDGIDGNSNCAGAVVSMYSLQKSEKMGFDIAREIEKGNAGLVLMATDSLVSGIRQPQVLNDIVIVYKTPG